MPVGAIRCHPIAEGFIGAWGGRGRQSKIARIPFVLRVAIIGDKIHQQRAFVGCCTFTNRSLWIEHATTFHEASILFQLTRKTQHSIMT